MVLNKSTFGNDKNDEDDKYCRGHNNCRYYDYIIVLGIIILMIIILIIIKRQRCFVNALNLLYFRCRIIFHLPVLQLVDSHRNVTFGA